ncbi:MAG: HD domain-containing protein [Rhodocyclaceae bacterium]|jgi:putative nucleotidyltransferase with HDIG domain|nr:HD domain-containing protein [Rhodocyclaceae bacterium]
MKIDPHRTICALTSVLDFVGIDELQHGKRVALMAEAIARQLGWSDSRQAYMFYAGMLHDCGVSRAAEHRHLTDSLLWDGAEAHCERGASYLLDCPPLADFAATIRWHHTDWATLARQPLEDADKLAANLIFLADRVDVLQAPSLAAVSTDRDVLCIRGEIIATIRAHAGGLFEPGLVEAFATVAAREAFWLAMDPYYLQEYLENYPHPAPVRELENQDVLSLARLFARVVDAKSHFTHEHSLRVAAIARHLYALTGAGEDALDMMEMAGLLHDIGKLRVPDEIIDKPGGLTPAERAVICRHSYDTYRILSRIFPETPIARWAASHHENLLGTGYPFGLGAAELGLEPRILSVADVFQALSQNRPYRDRLDAPTVLAHLGRMADEGQLDPVIVALAEGQAAALYALAIGTSV